MLSIQSRQPETMEPLKTMRILLADDHAMFRECLRKFLGLQPDMTVVGEAADGLTAVALAKSTQPDLVVMDISMPKLDGVEATRTIRQACPKARVLALTAHACPSMLLLMGKAGASGYVLKCSPLSELLTALRTLARGEVYIDAELRSQAAGILADGNHAKPRIGPDLSHREVQVLRYLALGYSAKEAAAELKLSTKSVETYKKRLMAKLEITSHVELVRYARLQGLAETV